METKIPTADELFMRMSKDKGFNVHRLDFLTEAVMIEFAELHVREALEAAYNNATFTTDSGVTMKFSDGDLNKESITNAYPKANIK